MFCIHVNLFFQMIFQKEFMLGATASSSCSSSVSVCACQHVWCVCLRVCIKWFITFVLSRYISPSLCSCPFSLLCVWLGWIPLCLLFHGHRGSQHWLGCWVWPLPCTNCCFHQREFILGNSMLGKGVGDLWTVGYTVASVEASRACWRYGQMVY